MTRLGDLFRSMASPQPIARALGNLYATKVLACSCGAPGSYHSRRNETRCYDPNRDGQAVGLICPACGARRPPDQVLGKIWSGKV